MTFLKHIVFTAALFVFSQTIFGQNIIVNDTYTAQQLVQNVLVNNPCATVSNFSISGGNFGSGEQSYGYFNAGTSGFPFTEGVVLSTSRAVSTQGPNSTLLSEDAPNWVGDNDLEQALSISNTSNATILEFDFVPFTSHISFDYIFASEEYHGTAPCQYSDGFAFLIKEAGTNNQYINLALVPNTQIPVKVTSVHPLITNGCAAQNEAYFGNYNGIISPINFNGQTIAMKAQAGVIPGNVYHIKLVIADETNPQYDSAIFLGGGSFKADADLGPDRLIATNNPVCYGDSYILDATVAGTNTYQWFENGLAITGATNPTYLVTHSGVYSVEIHLGGTPCVVTGEVTIEYTTLPSLNVISLYQCDDNADGISTFNLTTLNNQLNGGNNQLAVTFYESLSDAQNEINPISNANAFQNITLNKVYANITSSFGCPTFAEINLLISNNTIAPQNPLIECDADAIQDGITTFDLSIKTPDILFGLPSGLIVEYYATENDAVLQTNPLPLNYTNTTAGFQTIYARIINGTDCYGIAPIDLKVNTFTLQNFSDETLYICDNSTILLEVASGFSSYLWSDGSTNNYLNCSTAGIYTVTIANVDGCTKTKKFNVLLSGSATINSIDVNDFTGNNNSVQVNVSGTGNGDYEYSIDGVVYQESNYFSNIFPGEYIVFVKDKNGCAMVSQQITVLDYPKFFTPNGDGINDIWKIKNLENQPNAIISIFDRFGKLIYYFNANESGWDGKLYKKDLVSSDYWFVLEFENGKTVKGHFALKR